MLERPDLPDATIHACLRQAYGLPVAEVEFLPLGVDTDAAVYRVVTAGGAAYFLKLRRGPFNDILVTLPRALRDQGVRQIIAPLPALDGLLWASVDGFKAILYPYIDGRDGYTVPLTDAHWRELGAALRQIHNAPLPPELLAQIPQETYTPRWCDSVRDLIARLDDRPPRDAIAVETASFLRANAAIVLDPVARAARLRRQLRDRPPPLVVCHADLHAGNVLIGEDGTLTIVDWDNPIRAPKERDLMFAGGYQFGGTRSPAEEERLFYAGYGPAQVNQTALAYYRYIRILEDVALFAEDIFQGRVGDDDRSQALHYLKSNFLPGATIATALVGDRTPALPRSTP